MEKRVCLIVFHEFTTDSRILRETKSLVDGGYKVSIFALHQDGLPEHEQVYGAEVHRIHLKSRGLPRRRIIQLIKYMEYLPKAFVAIREKAPSICHCYGLYALPVGYLISKWTGAKLIYDSPELESAFLNPAWFRWLSRQLEHFLIRRVDKVITVCDSIANELAKQDGIEKPTVVRNIPEYADIANSNKIREILHISRDKKIILYQGGLLPDRKLGTLVRAMPLINDEAILVFMGSGEARAELEKAIEEENLRPRVKFMDRVPPLDLLSYTSSADIGVCPRAKTSLNNYYSLPNKLFEYIMAELPVAVSNFPEMSKIVEQYGVGVVFDPEDVKDIARAINELLEDREKYAQMKENTKRAKKVLNWENESRKLLEIYEELLR